jgi:hypothetical protein
MATEGYVLGHNLRVFIKDGSTMKGVGRAKSCSMKIDTEMKEISDKDVEPGSLVGGAVVRIPNKVGAEMSTNCYVTEDSISDYAALLDLMLDAEKVTVVFTTNVAGDTAVTFDAYISSVQANADDGSEAEYSVTFVSTSMPEVTVVSA